MKLCILGFDALDSNLFERSKLTAFQQLRDTGQWGTLYSLSMMTGPAWTTILTGLEIENHGITDLLGFPRNNSEWFLSRPKDYIFDALHDAGLSVGVANFPSLTHSREIGTHDHTRSWMIAGWPNAPTITPDRELPYDLCSDFPDYERRFLDWDRRKPKGALSDWAIHEIPWDEYIEWAGLNAFRRIEVIKSLPQTDVLMIQESVLDRAAHMLSTPNKGKLGTEDNRYNQALALVDALIKDVIDVWQPEYLAIVSDHGFQGLSEAEPEKGCWHSHTGTWAIVGPGIVPVRNNMDQVHFSATILQAVDMPFIKGKDGKQKLITDDFSNVEQTLRGLGYL